MKYTANWKGLLWPWKVLWLSDVLCFLLRGENLCLLANLARQKIIPVVKSVFLGKTSFIHAECIECSMASRSPRGTAQISERVGQAHSPGLRHGGWGEAGCCSQAVGPKGLPVAGIWVLLQQQRKHHQKSDAPSAAAELCLLAIDSIAEDKGLRFNQMHLWGYGGFELAFEKWER